jgi:sulfatase modifying factor 1
MKLRLIPPGEFLMGSTQEQIDAALKADGRTADQSLSSILSYELPQHRVVISRPLWVATTEVTIGQFRRFVQGTNYVTETERLGGGPRNAGEASDPAALWHQPGYAVTDESPVTLVTWNDAVEFCNWLSQQVKLTPRYDRNSTGQWAAVPLADGYHLPTDAQWEYACRAGTTTQYSFGDDPLQLDGFGWHFDNSGGESRAAAPVGLKAPNPFGLFDMHGNVLEWCQDRFDPTWYATSPVEDPECPLDGGGYHTVRGGSWWNRAVSSRSAFHTSGSGTQLFSHLGFRVVRPVPRASRESPKPATPVPVAPARAVTESRPPDYAQERAVAEWVLSAGGTLSVTGAAGKQVRVAAASLPAYPFVVDSIDLHQNPEIQDEDLARFAALSSLRGVDLTRNPQLSDAGLAQLADVPSLEWLYLDYTALTDAGLRELAKLPRLTKLWLLNTQVTDEGLAHLGAAARLEQLMVNSLPITIRGLRALRGLPLKNLSFGHTGVQYSDLPEVAALFPDLREIDVQRLPGDIGMGFSPLAQLSQLEHVRIVAAEVSADAPHQLRQLPRLTTLSLRSFGAPAEGWAEELELLPRVTRLSLHGADFQGSAMAKLGANTTIERLTLSQWSGGDAELLGLIRMKKLRELTLTSTRVTAAGVEEFHKLRPDVAITGDFNIPAEPPASTTPPRGTPSAR